MLRAGSICEKGFYRDGGQCAVCDPASTECEFGIALATLSLQSGWWRQARSRIGSREIRECLLPAACIGGIAAESDFASGQQYCAKEYEGPLCAVSRGDLKLMASEFIEFLMPL